MPSQIVRYRYPLLASLLLIVFAAIIFLVGARVVDKIKLQLSLTQQSLSQTPLLYQMASDINQTHLLLMQGASVDFSKTAEELQKMRQSFERNLHDFEQKSTNTQTQVLARKIRPLWDTYSKLIDQATINYTQADSQNLVDLVDYTRAFNSYLLGYSAQLGDIFEADLIRMQEKLHLLHIIAIIGILIIFGLVWWRSWWRKRQLNNSQELLTDSHRQTEQILAATRDGLLLIDEKLVISERYSLRLEKILGQDQLGGRLFDQTLSKIATAESIEMVRLFVRQMFKPHVFEDLLHNLNPLDCVKINGVDEHSSAESPRYLRFYFSRIYDAQQQVIERILVTISDITEEVKMQENFAVERAQNEDLMQLIHKVLRSSPQRITLFLQAAIARVNSINEILKNQSSGEDLRLKLDKIFREVHSLKGEVSSLKLRAYLNICEQFENLIQEVRQKEHLANNDFLPLTVQLEELFRLNHLIEVLGNKNRDSKIDGLMENATTPLFVSYANLEDEYQQFASDIAERNGKKVVLSCKGLDNPNLTSSQRAFLHEITTQFLRNAIVHGIEPPSLRQNIGKTDAGTVRLTLLPLNDQQMEFIIEDDGCGLQFNKIRQKAVDSGKYTLEEAERLNEQQLIALMFTSNISTAETPNEDAGRGVGLDIVRDRISWLQGAIKVSTTSGKYTRFNITFPFSKQA